MDRPHNFHPTTEHMASRIPATEPPIMEASGNCAVPDLEEGGSWVDEGAGENIVVVTT